jgi:hypothetical protein
MAQSLPPGVSLVVAVPDPKRSGSFGNSLALYAAATGKGPPRPARDIACEEVSTRVASDTVAVVLFSHLCPLTGRVAETPMSRAADQYIEVDWKTFRPRIAEQSVALWVNNAG